MRYWAILLLPLLLTPAGAEQLSPEEVERWLSGETPDPQQFHSNLGELVFLAAPPARSIPRVHNRFDISAESLQSGWLTLTQCHERLDTVAALEIVYSYREMQDLHIRESRHIGAARVQDHSVQMTDIGTDNRICIQARVRILHANEDGGYRLRNGPYHRKFLDGYFPYQVGFEFHYPAQLLEVASIVPQPQPGLELTTAPGRLSLDAWFEGRLMLEVVFRQH
jgi:hypothetical protein